MRATTSASNIHRRVLCPGSAREEEKFVETESDYSAEGTLLHSLFMAHPATEEQKLARIGLSAEQEETLASAERLAMDFITTFMESQNIPADAEHQFLREVELTFRTANGPLFPGHADLIVNWPQIKARAVIDAKMGFMEVEEAASNFQLAVYAVQAQQRDPVEVCAVCICQPRNFGPKSSSAIYTAGALKLAEKTIFKAFAASQKPDAPLIAGEEQCHFCRAKTACPEFRKTFGQLATVGTRAVATLNNDEIVSVHRAIQFANKIKDEVRDEMRRRITDGELPGWKLRNTGDTREMSDMVAAYASLKGALPELTGADFMASTSIVWGKLTKQICTLTGYSKKRAEQFIEDVLAEHITRKPKQPSPTPIE